MYNSSLRLAAHGHVRGLGVHAGKPEFYRDGIVGQLEAREALYVVAQLVRKRQMAGKAVLLAGPSGSGKTALAIGLRYQLEESSPFVHFAGSEVYSAEVKKTEILQECFRRSVAIRIKESKDVYEGEVMELTPEETENPHGGYAKSLSAVLITLKTVRGSKTLRLAPTIHDALSRERVAVGDVVYIEAATGIVKRCGRSESFATAFDLEMDHYVPLPKGEVYKKKEIAQVVSLHDLDMANLKPDGGKDLASVVREFSSANKIEVTDRLRQEVNNIVSTYVQEGVAEVIPGVVFIDECHMLDLECFTFLNRAVESPMTPIVVMATNRGAAIVKDDPYEEQRTSLHGIPVDLLDRLLIINTKPYTPEELTQVLIARLEVEGLEIGDEPMAQLVNIASRTSLRFALSLVQPASMIAQLEDRPVTVEDIREADSIYVDPATSGIFLSSVKADKYL